MAKLECIFDIEKDAKKEEQYNNIYESLKERYGTGKYKQFTFSDLFENHKCESRYARNVYTGKIKKGINLTELERSMICDGGYSHFGGSSVIRSDRTFEVNIYTD